MFHGIGGRCRGLRGAAGVQKVRRTATRPLTLIACASLRGRRRGDDSLAPPGSSRASLLSFVDGVGLQRSWRGCATLHISKGGCPGSARGDHPGTATKRHARA